MGNTVPPSSALEAVPALLQQTSVVPGRTPAEHPALLLGTVACTWREGPGGPRGVCPCRPGVPPQLRVQKSSVTALLLRLDRPHSRCLMRTRGARLLWLAQRWGLASWALSACPPWVLSQRALPAPLCDGGSRLWQDLPSLESIKY